MRRTRATLERLPLRAAHPRLAALGALDAFGISLKVAWRVVAALLAAGARFDAADAEGSSPLRFALAQSSHARVVHTLLQAGAAFEEL